MLFFLSPEWQTELEPQTPKWLRAAVTANSWEMSKKITVQFQG